MKLAFVTPRFYPHIGGVETHVYEIAKRMKEFEVEVLATDPSGRLAKSEEIDGIRVRRFRSYAPSDAYFFSLELYRYLKRNAKNYDLVHAHNFHAFPALLAALSEPRKFVFSPHYHGHGHSFLRNILFKPYRAYARRIFDKADAIVCVSNFEKSLVMADFKVEGSRIHVIPNGVNLEAFRGVEEIKKRKEKGLRRILYVGRIEKYKGLEYAVRALNLLPENYVLEIVGKGRYRKKIVELAEKLGVIDRIKFYQDLDWNELLERYALADVLVLLSKHEAYGLVVAEALAAKTPCVVAKTSALAEWIDERNVFGIEYPIDVRKLAELIKSIDAKVEFKLTSWDEVAEKLKEIYRDL